LGIFKNPKNLTEEEFFKVINVNSKWQNYFNIYIINKIFYTLHYTFLIIFIFYDLIYNNLVISATFKYLPFMLLYQIYINLSKFVLEKPLTDICEEANIFFYHKIIYVSSKAMLVDGVLYDIPETFPEDFLRYEASGFTKY
jgi:hypothetical protein